MGLTASDGAVDHLWQYSGGRTQEGSKSKTHSLESKYRNPQLQCLVPDEIQTQLNEYCSALHGVTVVKSLLGLLVTGVKAEQPEEAVSLGGGESWILECLPQTNLSSVLLKGIKEVKAAL